MHDELIKDLRENHDKYFSRDMQAANVIKELQRQKDEWEFHATVAEIMATNQWISVTEQLPEHSGNYLVYSVGGNWKQLSTIEIAFWNDKNFIVQSFFAVTHWMPLPEPPKEE